MRGLHWLVVALQTLTHVCCPHTCMVRLHAGDEPPQRTAVRLLTRLGAASCYQKQYAGSAAAYQAAQQLCSLLGDAERAAQLEADLQRVVSMQRGREAVAVA